MHRENTFAEKFKNMLIWKIEFRGQALDPEMTKRKFRVRIRSDR